MALADAPVRAAAFFEAFLARRVVALLALFPAFFEPFRVAFTDLEAFFVALAVFFGDFLVTLAFGFFAIPEPLCLT